MLPTQVLRFAVQNYGKDITCQIPPNLSKGYLVKVVDLIEATKVFSFQPGED
jgi:hypothetical protein